MRKTITKADLEDLFRFAGVYAALSEESKELVFAFMQGMETQQLIAANRNTTNG